MTSGKKISQRRSYDQLTNKGEQVMKNDFMEQFLNTVAELRQKVIVSGARPTTLLVSQSAIEEMKVFGMNIEVVSSVVMPKGIKLMVVEDKDLL